MCPGGDIAVASASDVGGRAGAAPAREGGRKRGPATDRPSRARRSPTTKGRSTSRAARFIRSASRARIRRIKWIVLFITLGIYYALPFVRWDRGPNAPEPGGAGRFSEPALLLLLHRDLAAGNLLPHRSPHHRRDGAVPDERGRRPRLVRLSLSADGVDRPVPDRRALVRGRPPRAHAARPAAVDRSSGSRGPRSSISSGS